MKYSLNRLCSNWLKFQFDQRKKNFSSRKGKEKKEAWEKGEKKDAVVAMTHQAEGLIQPYFN